MHPLGAVWLSKVAGRKKSGPGIRRIELFRQVHPVGSPMPSQPIIRFLDSHLHRPQIPGITLSMNKPTRSRGNYW